MSDPDAADAADGAAGPDPLRLTVLGSSGSYPGPGLACSGYLVRGGGVNVVLDLGSGSLANLQEHIDISAIDAVVVSHSHPDHWLDLGVLATAWKYGLDRHGLRVHGTSETRAKAEVLTDGLAPTFDWIDVAAGDEVHVAGPDGRGLTLRFSWTDHYVPTLATLVTDGTSTLAYSADTGPAWSFASFAEPIDLALCDATHLVDGEARQVLHLSGRQAGSMARDAGVGHLVVTHVGPGIDPEAVRAEAAASFGAEVGLAVEHATFVA
jgi:ribonuclease BN (tRNA processing enzyme)